MRHISIKLSCLLLLFILLPAPFASARAADDFNVMMDNAYTSFRSAFWYTKTGNPGVASMEMMMFDMQWRTLRQTFETEPPDDYANDTQWPETLSAIANANTKAMELVNTGKIQEAHKAVTQIRDELADLRKRNGITAFSDYVNAFGALIDVISPLRKWEHELSEDDWSLMKEKAVEMAAAIDAIEGNAPATLSSNEPFLQTVQDNRRAVALFAKHLKNRFERGAKGSIRDIRSAFGLLFLKYG